jgi:hypothetical protein
VCIGTPLGASDRGTGSYRQPHAAGVREAVCEAREDRRSGRRGDLRGGDPTDDALRCDQDRGTAGDANAAQDTRSVGTPAHYADECATGSSGRVWHRQRAGCRRCRIGDQGAARGPGDLPVLARFALHGLVASCAASKGRSRKSRQKSSSGIEPTRRAADWRRSQASARSRRARSPRVLAARRALTASSANVLLIMNHLRGRRRHRCSPYA